MKKVGKAEDRTAIQTYADFPGKDVSAAIVWPGNIKIEPPIVDINSKRNSKHSVLHNHILQAVLQPEKTTWLVTLARGICLHFLRKTMYGDLSSISASGAFGSQSWSLSSSLFDGSSSHGGQTIQATAWDLVIITANAGGQIRVYLNFGLPLKVVRKLAVKENSMKRREGKRRILRLGYLTEFDQLDKCPKEEKISKFEEYEGIDLQNDSYWIRDSDGARGIFCTPFLQFEKTAMKGFKE
ncbi:Hypothetical predicted protein [Olea europaea subsp. europaea]|uniref:Uncharacterized protein n=1 Tax=Olea europaea subsp. europaea TaxID=158383 RepID=A0A8S0V1Z4_OLEEU|nr:Hypothetical predicted protein [Olea europaea subsp. europaea]